MKRETVIVQTNGRDLYEITDKLQNVVSSSGIAHGLCNVFVHHTSASLTIQENADPNVQHDLNAWMSRLVEDGDAIFRHREEGPDDMSAHIRSALTDVSLTIPVVDGRCALGTWQGVLLWEHRTSPHKRKVTISIW